MEVHTTKWSLISNWHKWGHFWHHLAITGWAPALPSMVPMHLMWRPLSTRGRETAVWRAGLIKIQALLGKERSFMFYIDGPERWTETLLEDFSPFFSECFWPLVTLLLIRRAVRARGEQVFQKENVSFTILGIWIHPFNFQFTSWATTATSSHEEGSVTVTTQFKPRKIIHCRREECVARRVMMAGGVTKFGLSWGVPHYSFPGTFLQASFLPSGSSSTGPEGFLPTCTAFWQPALLCRIQQHHFPGSCVCERVCVCV